MEFSQTAKTVFDRIQRLDPQNVSKIVGYLLLQDFGENEIAQLALGPDSLLHAFIRKAKSELGLSPKLSILTQFPSSVNLTSIDDPSLRFIPFSPTISRPFSSPANFNASSSYWDKHIVGEQPPVHNMDLAPATFVNSTVDDYRFHNHSQFLSVEDHMDTVNPAGAEFSRNSYFQDSTFVGLGARSSRRSPSLPEFPFKTCHYFNKGFCRHVENCRYSHSPSFSDSFSQITLSEMSGDDHLLPPASLEMLELEIVELLKSRRGFPLSIASLPMLYCEKYGKSLQAEGYLTESQRHGKAGYNLTKLLVRMNKICLIDRPHGQHAVILAEDASKYMECKNKRSDPGAIVVGSRQIYLTFPAESTFTEEDVSNYFNGFGPVQDVRIPCQQKRMFGFVTFVYPETAKLILTKGNPHFVCGSRVLVKPYREKSQLVDRRYSEKIESPVYYPHFLDVDPELHSMPRVYDSRLMRNELMEDQEQALEIERRLSELHSAPKTVGQSQPVNQMEELKLTEVHADNNESYLSDQFNYLFDVLKIGSSDHTAKNKGTAHSDQES